MVNLIKPSDQSKADQAAEDKKAVADRKAAVDKAAADEQANDEAKAELVDNDDDKREDEHDSNEAMETAAAEAQRDALNNAENTVKGQPMPRNEGNHPSGRI